MMTGDAVSIVEEFWGSTDPQVRMNAMTAYGVIGNQQSIDALVQVALGADVDVMLRQRAEQELAALTDTKAQILIEKLQEILNVPEKKEKASLPTGRLQIKEFLKKILKDLERKENAYLLAGRLRSRGLPLEGSGLPLAEQLKLIYTTRSRLYPVRNWNFNIRTLLSGLVAGLVGAVLALILGNLLDKSFGGLLLIGVLTAPAMSLAASRLVVPFSLQIDRREAALFEIVFTAFGGLIIGTAMFVAFLLVLDLDVMSLIGTLLLGTTLLLGAVRLGTLVWYDVFPGRRRRRFFQIMLGTIVGLLLLGLTLYMGMRVGIIKEGDQVFLIYVFYFLPLAFAAANGFAHIDGAEDSKNLAPKRAVHTRRNAKQSFGAVTIVEEYMRSTDPEIRLNAVRALVTLKNKRSIAWVFEVALQDEDEKTQSYAEKELTRLADDEEMFDLTRAALQDAMAEKGQHRAAYRLAGQLRSRGFPIKSSGLPWLKRIWLAYSMRSLLYPKRGWGFRLRGLESGLLGGILGAMLALVFLLITGLFRNQASEPVAMPLLIYGVIVAVGAGLLAGPFTVPIHQYVDRQSGMLIELLRAAFWAFVVAVLLTVLALMLEFEDNSLFLILVPAFSLFLLIPIIRTGTLFGYRAFTGLRTNRLAQATVGATWGLLALTAMSKLLLSSDIPSTTPVLDQVYNNLDVFWLGLVPACFAVATVFARIDGKEAPLKRIDGKEAPLEPLLRRTLVYVFAGILVLPFLLALLSRVVPPPHQHEVYVYKNQDFRTYEGPTDIVYIKPDTSYTLRVLVPGEVHLKIDSSLTFHVEPEVGDYDITLRNTKTNRPLPFDQIHEKGAYTVLIVPIDTDTKFSIFPKLGERLSLGLNLEPSSIQHFIFTSHSALNETKEFALMELFNQLSDLAGTDAVRNTVKRISTASTDSKVKAILESNAPIISARDWNTLCWRGSLVGLHADSLVIDACEKAVRYGVRRKARASYRHSRGVNKLLNLGNNLEDEKLDGIIADFDAFIDTANVDAAIIRETQRWIDSLKQDVNPLTVKVKEDLRQLTFAMGGNDDIDVLTVVRYLLDQLAYSSDPKHYQEVLNKLDTDEVKAVLARNTAFIPAMLWNTLCWRGSLVGLHADNLVIDACEKAVAYELNLSSESLSRDSRAVNKLMNWDTLVLSEDVPWIIEDLRAYVRDSGRSTERTHQREHWIEALTQKDEQGNPQPVNPLTPDVLNQLRCQSSINCREAGQE